MLCMSIMTNAYIIGFMSPRVELQQISDLRPIRPCLLSGRRTRRQNSSNQLIKSFPRLCLSRAVCFQMNAKLDWTERFPLMNFVIPNKKVFVRSFIFVRGKDTDSSRLLRFSALYSRCRDVALW